MPEKPKFHLDECVTIKVAEGLNNRDRGCTTSQAAGLMGTSDPEQLAYAKAEQRIIITTSLSC